MVNTNLKNILVDISKANPQGFTIEDKEILIEDLNSFYKQNERHKYSDIADYIYDNAESMEYLIKNLQELHSFCEHDNDSIKTRIFKIIDHIQLERVRIAYLQDVNREQTIHNIANINNTVSRKTKKMLTDLQVVTKTANNLEKEVEDVGDRLKTFNMESITVLGIFSGIVMAFFGGMSFFNGVLNNIHQVSKYRIFFTTLIIGFTLFNILFLLIYSIAKIVDRPIRSTCLEFDCRKCHKDCDSITTLRKVYPVLFYIDLIFILMMVLLVIMWFFKI